MSLDGTVPEQAFWEEYRPISPVRNWLQFGSLIGQLFTFALQIGVVNGAATDMATPHDGRIQPRTHLFVAATLYSSAGSGPVNVRNMSTTGALIEGSALPEPGTEVVLKRGSLQTSAIIVWINGRRAGLACKSILHAADWMSRQVSLRQQDVDEFISSLKLDLGSRSNPGLLDTNQISIETELKLLRDELSELGKSLIGDVVLVATHPEIQILDISLQRVDRLIERL